MVTPLNAQTFHSFINTPQITLVDFYADWCGPCKMIAPILEQLSQETAQIHFGKINVDEAGDIAQEYNVSSIPSLLVFQNGSVINTIVGAQGKDAIKKALGI